MCERCERRRSREPPLPPWLEPLDPLAVATPPYLLGGGGYPPATCVVFLGGGCWVFLFGAPPLEAKRARPYPLSGVGRGARAGYAAFIFEGCSIFLWIANFPLEFTSKLNGVG